MTAREYAINAHGSKNDLYADYLPYRFHLEMVAAVGEQFIKLVPVALRKVANNGLWLHDAIENGVLTYNSIKSEFGWDVAEIVLAVTPYNRGRNRAEKMPDFVYKDIKETPCATFIKLCDRIANVRYSKMTGTKMLETYKKENTRFRQMLHDEGTPWQPMWDYLHNILLKD